MIHILQSTLPISVSILFLLNSQSAHADSVEYFKLSNLYTGTDGYCLIDSSGDIDETNSTATGIATADCTWNDGVDERRAHWYTEDTDSGSVYIINRYSGRKLKYSDTDMAGGNKTLLYVDGSDTSADTEWTLEAESAHFHIKSASHSSYSLFIKNTGDVELVPNTIYTRSDWGKCMLPSGASTPLTRYDETNVTSGYVSLVDDVENEIRAIESDGNACLELPYGKGINWIATAPANGVTIRYSLEDATNGGGINASITLRNKTTSQNVGVPVTSKYAWLYGPENAETNNPADGEDRRVFDHVRAKLDINIGDEIRIDHGGDTNTIWIDFIETEVIPEANTAPVGATVVTSNDDLQDAIDNASTGDVIFLTEGTYTLDDAVRIYDDITLFGAGMWHTTLNFTNTSTAGGAGTVGGIYVYNHATLTARNFDMTGTATCRGEGGSAFNAWNGTGFGDNSLIDSVSWSHLGVARFHGANNMRVLNCRAYDNSAGGIITMANSDDFVADNNIVRHAGDDSIASWSANAADYNDRYECRYNTVEFGVRAAGLGLFGGRDSVFYKNRIRNMLPSCQGALRVTSTFPGTGFYTASDCIFIDNELESCKGDAQIVFLTRDYAINNVQFMNIDISDADLTTEGIVKIWYNGSGAGDTIEDISFDTITADQGSSTQSFYNVVSSGIQGDALFIDCTQTATVTPNAPINSSSGTFDVTKTNCSF